MELLILKQQMLGKFFPSFDEPAMKATFTFTLIAPKHAAVIGNTLGQFSNNIYIYLYHPCTPHTQFTNKLCVIYTK